jgi:hypothetical protein
MQTKSTLKEVVPAPVAAIVVILVMSVGMPVACLCRRVGVAVYDAMNFF